LHTLHHPTPLDLLYDPAMPTQTSSQPSADTQFSVKLLVQHKDPLPQIFVSQNHFSTPQVHPSSQDTLIAMAEVMHVDTQAAAAVGPPDPPRGPPGDRRAPEGEFTF
jgi:hypothetical protein